MQRAPDPVWEDLYDRGKGARYPWDSVVSFVYRYSPQVRPRGSVRILEVGCGAGANLWFAAKEGFAVSGTDGSPSAIALAQERFQKDHLACDLRVAIFPDIPFPTDYFDLVIDRAALCCVGLSVAKATIQEIARVLMKGGYMYSAGYSKECTSYRSGCQTDDGITADITTGTLRGVGQIAFHDTAGVIALFPAEEWVIEELKQVQTTYEAPRSGTRHVELHTIARRIS